MWKFQSLLMGSWILCIIFILDGIPFYLFPLSLVLSLGTKYDFFILQFICYFIFIDFCFKVALQAKVHLNVACSTCCTNPSSTIYVVAPPIVLDLVVPISVKMFFNIPCILGPICKFYAIFFSCNILC